ncbi:hypothetical protein Tco_0436551 [Tanacetum coccineum]
MIYVPLRYENGGVKDWYQELQILMAHPLSPDHIAYLPEVDQAQTQLAQEVTELASPVPDHGIEDPGEDP